MGPLRLRKSELAGRVNGRVKPSTRETGPPQSGPPGFGRRVNFLPIFAVHRFDGRFAGRSPARILILWQRDNRIAPSDRAAKLRSGGAKPIVAKSDDNQPLLECCTGRCGSQIKCVWQPAADVFNVL